MKFSLMTYTVGPSWPGGCQSLEEMADLAASLGFEALELSAGHLTETTAREFGTMCSDRGLGVSCINGGCTLSTPDDSEFAQGLDQAKYYVDSAVEMGCPVVMLLPGPAQNEADKPRAAGRIADGLTQIVEYASDKGIFITLEDFPNLLTPYGSIAELRWMLETVPGLHLTFDNGNWMISGDDPLAALKIFGQYVVNVHLKDWEPDPDCQRIRRVDGSWIRGGKHGQGLIDHKAILSELKSLGYGGYMAFEYEGPEDHAQATREGIAYLRSVLAGL